MAAPAGGLPDLKLLSLFGVGAVIMRGAGCTINDLWDRDIDKLVERTKNRPIACGAISVPQAIGFLTLQLSGGLAILVQLNYETITLGAASLVLVGTYPLMKRVTWWPQAFLGLTFNWGALLGWCAVHGDVDFAVCGPLYLGAISWTMVYDTIYAHMDKKDDEKAGVMSSARGFGQYTKPGLAVFAGMTVAGIGGSGAAAGLAWPFYAATTAGGAHLAWQIAKADLNSPTDCLEKFKSNKWFGAVIFSGIVLGNYAA